MSEEYKNYRSMEELSGSDYQIVGDEPNIIGWKVKNESDVYIGQVVELLFDSETRAVRYLVIEIDGSSLLPGDKKFAIPIGIAHLHASEDEVVLPNLHTDQFKLLPVYKKDDFRQDTEIRIRQVIGSPAALRIEESINEIDQDTFYDNHHFDKAAFYKRGGPDTSPRTEI